MAHFDDNYINNLKNWNFVHVKDIQEAVEEFQLRQNRQRQWFPDLDKLNKQELLKYIIDTFDSIDKDLKEIFGTFTNQSHTSQGGLNGDGGSRSDKGITASCNKRVPSTANNQNQICECGHDKENHVFVGCIEKDENNDDCECLEFQPVRRGE